MLHALAPLTLIGLMLLGGALLWTVQLVYGSHRTSADDVVQKILSIAGWLLIIVGLLGLIASMVSVLAFPVWIILVIVLFMTVARYRASERKALLWTLAIAAERGVPLDQAARAYGNERTDEQGFRALRLADLLHDGVALPEALRRSGNVFSVDGALAAELGCQIDVLGAALRQAATRVDESEEAVQAICDKFFYLCLIVVVASHFVLFMMLKIVPVFAKMFAEFELALPPSTLLTINLANQLLASWFVMMPFYLLLLLLMLLGVMYYVGWMPTDLPLVNRLALRIDSARIMRALALAAGAGRSLVETLNLLALRYPKGNIRFRLTTALRHINNGVEWQESLRAVGLIRRPEAVVLSAAQQVGNLKWALEEMADSSTRRLAIRLRGWFNALFPVIFLAFATAIGFLLISMFIPLISLIQGLS